MMDTQPNVGTDLVRIHKVVTRALGVLLLNVFDPNTGGKHRAGFLSYVRSLTILLHAHHSGEDELAFPFWKIRFPSGPFEELSGHHRQMVLYLERMEEWIKIGDAAWLEGALKALQNVISDLQTLWHEHIALEEAVIGPEKARQYLSVSENQQLGKQISEHSQAHSQPGELVMPFIVYNLSGSDRTEFLKLLPPVVSGQLIPIVWKTVWEPMTPFLLVE
jgi:hemerythrin-like domain-containing protein